MGKVEINNEIVLLRHTVRQARVCTVHKLIREAKLLRDKNGTDIQRQKNTKKADKLIAEVYALKTIKDDEISKFGIMNEKEVKDILQNKSLSNKDRVIARVVGYKSFHRRLMQFRERFPDYKMYLSEGKKKTTKLKNKNSVKSKKSLARSNQRPQRKSTKKQDTVSDESVEDCQDNSKDEESCTSRSCETKNNSGKRKKSSNEDDTVSVKKKLPRLVQDNPSEDANKQPSEIKLCSVTREGTVKRFAELLEEQDSTKDPQTSAESPQTDHKDGTTVQAKPVDDFFITGSDEGGCQRNLTNASTSHARFDAPAKTLRSSSRIKTQSARFKNDKRIEDNKAEKNNQFEKHSRGKRMVGRDKYSVKQSSGMRQEKRTSNKINKNTNKNSNVDNDEKTADLHPSWLAKKKQQEVMNQGFQGKKIVFAED